MLIVAPSVTHTATNANDNHSVRRVRIGVSAHATATEAYDAYMAKTTTKLHADGGQRRDLQIGHSAAGASRAQTLPHWLLKALATALPDFISGTQARLTYVSQDFQLPLALIGITVTLFWGMRRRPVESVVLIAVLLAVIIATGYRSQAILVALLWVVYVARQPRRRRFGLTIASLAIAGALLGWLVSSPFGETYLARFEDLQDELRSQRAVETLYGYSKFSEAPILGKGLGFPVPLAVNQFGATEPVSVATSDHVGYLHNVWIYLCMDLGLLGLVAYLAFFAASIRTGLKSGASAGDATVAVSVTVATLLLYFTVEAAFREIQMNFLLGSLCAVLAKTERSTAQRVPAAGA